MATHNYPATRKSPSRPSAVPQTLADAAASGDRRATLEALRDVLARSIGEAGLRDRAALSARLVDVLGQLDRMPVQETNPVTALQDRVAAKLAAARQAR